MTTRSLESDGRRRIASVAARRTVERIYPNVAIDRVAESAAGRGPFGRPSSQARYPLLCFTRWPLADDDRRAALALRNEGQHLSILRDRREQRIERHRLSRGTAVQRAVSTRPVAERQVFSQIHDTNSAAAEQRLDAIVAEDVALLHCATKA